MIVRKIKNSNNLTFQNQKKIIEILIIFKLFLNLEKFYKKKNENFFQ